MDKSLQFVYIYEVFLLIEFPYVAVHSSPIDFEIKIVG